MIRDVTVTFGMQIVLSALIHIVLVFPRSLLSAHVLNKILPIVYVVPSGLMAFFLLHYAESNFIDHMTSVYTARLWLDTSLLLLSVVILILNSRGHLTGIQREQSRWLTRAIVTFTILHIGLWNLPKILTGYRVTR